MSYEIIATKYFISINFEPSFQFLKDIQVENTNNDICTANIKGQQNPLRTKLQVVEANIL